MKGEEQKEEEEKEIIKLEDRAGEEVSQGSLGGKEAEPGHGPLN